MLTSCTRCGDPASDSLCPQCIDEIELACSHVGKSASTPGPIAQKCAELLLHPHYLTAWEVGFLKSIQERNPSKLTPRQEASFRTAIARVQNKLEKQHGRARVDPT